MTEVSGPISWLNIHTFIYSPTAGLNSEQGAKVNLISPTKLSSDPSSCHWKQINTYPSHCPCCGFSQAIVPQGPCRFYLRALYTCCPFCLKYTSYKRILAPSLTTFWVVSKCCFFEEPFLTSPSKIICPSPTPSVLWSWSFFITFITSWADIFTIYLFIVFHLQENTNVMKGDIFFYLAHHIHGSK